MIRFNALYKTMQWGRESYKGSTMFKYLVCLVFIYAGLSATDGRRIARQGPRRFPDGFIFGAASASYQIEGAWDEDGKSESIWDHDTHQNPSPIDDHTTGDVAADSYHLYRRDVEMTRELGLDFYRFSLAWPRILPTGFPDVINQAGVDYYNTIIDELLSYNIQPMVTIFHWDLPQRLQDLGGWANPHIVDWYADYAKVVFDLFGDRVKLWTTMNEPTQICYFGYGSDALAPRLNMKGIGEYLCSRNLLLAHARAYHMYDEEYRSTQGGNIFITLSVRWYEPESELYEEAAEVNRQFDVGIYAHPIFVGDWPEVLKTRVGNKSAEQGFARSRLPELTQEEIDYIRGTSDYFGINHYTTYMVNINASAFSTYDIPSRDDDMSTNSYWLREWLIKETDAVRSVPWGFYNTLLYIRERYGNPPVMVTENGLGTYDADIDDDNRVTYYKLYLDAMLDAQEDGANVIGYTAWCMMDNMEWTAGYTIRYGLYHVDYTDANRTRTPRKSAFFYKEMLRTRTLDLDYEPQLTVMTIDPGH